jgi:DNA-binding NtrC family response regulator
VDETIRALMATLGGAKTFEDAAAVTLRALLALTTAPLAGSPWAKSGRMLRGVVHLRPGDGYRRLFSEEVTPGAPEGVSEGPRSLASATAWRWVKERERAVAIDVALSEIRVGLTDEAEKIRDEVQRFESQETRSRLLGRDATHVLALPLRAPGGSVDGMISLEASCRAATGKPFIWPSCLERLELLVSVAAPYLATLPLRSPVTALTDELLPVIGASMAGLVEMLRVFAQQEETILLSGRTGTGKSRLARWCHEQSARRGKRFETVDLRTAPDELQMGELFGWKKGAFTTALTDRAGCIARADEGTLFLDEIDKLSLNSQAGLLRVLEEKRYRPLGEGAGDRAADVRFIIGTNVDLYERVRAGHFREDLYYRINVLPLRVPTLAERADEIPRWAEYMLGRRHRGGSPGRSARLTPEAERALVAYTWPGNLRQLDNIVRRAYAFSLMEHGPQPVELVLTASHVERALAYEPDRDSKSLVDLFHLTATAFVAEAERRMAQGSAALDLDLVDALRGFVLGAATQQRGSRDEAFRLLGKEAMVSNRNHQKVMKRELEKVDAFCREFGRPSWSPVADLSDGDDT